jgi:mandelate racemase
MNSATPSPATTLAVRAVTTRGVRVPLTFVLGTSAAIVRAVPLLLVEVLMEEGVVGRAYVFCYSSSGAKAIAEHIVEAVELAKGHPAKPQAIFKMLSRRFTLLGVTGPVRMALSALDVALWDAAGCAAGLPLAELLGAERRPIPS